MVFLLLASERSERDTLRSVQLRIADIYIYIFINIYIVRAKFCSYNPSRGRSVILKLLPEVFVYVYVALRRALQ